MIVGDATNHPNLEVNTTYGVARGEGGTVKETIEKDGTLRVSVTCEFMVNHAAQVPITPETLAELIRDQGITAENVRDFFIFEVSDE